jgi:hypothetical protein
MQCGEPLLNCSGVARNRLGNCAARPWTPSILIHHVKAYESFPNALLMAILCVQANQAIQPIARVSDAADLVMGEEGANEIQFAMLRNIAERADRSVLHRWTSVSKLIVQRGTTVQIAKLRWVVGDILVRPTDGAFLKRNALPVHRFCGR